MRHTHITFVDDVTLHHLQKSILEKLQSEVVKHHNITREKDAMIDRVSIPDFLVIM